MKLTAGPFQILETLGEGSFATVCVATLNSDPLQRKCILKILKSDVVSNTRVIKRTRDEARLLSTLRHPNIVRVQRLLSWEGRPVIVMEYVRGISLRQLLLARGRSLEKAVAMEIARLTCEALDTAYNASFEPKNQPLKVIHRDIKPSNVLLSIHGDVKVIDFGIAQGEFEGREAETEAVVLGSRPYMAPERLDGRADDSSVDVYSTGMMLFELLTGSWMSLSINPDLHEQALQQHLDTLSDPSLQQLIGAMCAYKRQSRPTSKEAANTLADLIKRLPRKERVPLPQFAREVVVPLFDTRTRRPPEPELIAELTHSSAAHRLRPTPLALAMSMTIACLTMLAGFKFQTTNSSDILTQAQPQEVPAPLSKDLVPVDIWLPQDVQARIGDTYVPRTGRIHVAPGPILAQLLSDQGMLMHCTFEAHADRSIRYVVEDGQGSLSTDDGPAVPCSIVRP